MATGPVGEINTAGALPGGDLGGAALPSQVDGGGFPPLAPSQPLAPAAAAATSGVGTVASVVAPQASQPVLPSSQPPGSAVSAHGVGTSVSPAPGTSAAGSGISGVVGVVP